MVGRSLRWLTIVCRNQSLARNSWSGKTTAKHVNNGKPLSTSHRLGQNSLELLKPRLGVCFPQQPLAAGTPDH